MGNQKNARYQATHERLKQIVKEAMMEDPEQKITVAMITKRAEVNRKTFYLHFEVIEDLFEEVARDLATILAQKCQELTIDAPDYVAGNFNVFFSSINEDLSFHQLVITSKQAFFLYEDMMRYFVEDMADYYEDKLGLDRTTLKLLLSYISSGFMMLYRKWLWTGKPLSEGQLISLSQELVMGSLSALDLDGGAVQEDSNLL